MNWNTIVLELLGTGLTQLQLAELAQCSQSLVSDLASGKRGKRLGYAIGSRLVALHAERVGPRPAEVAA